MNIDKYSPEFLERLVRSLVSYSSEQTWFEFKRNCADPMRIGKYLSGLSNAALLANQPFGYLVIGIDDETHEIVGTDFQPQEQKTLGKNKGEMLLHWLQRGLSESLVAFDVFDVTICERHVCLFEVEAAKLRPTKFEGEGYCRIGSSLMNLRQNVALERELFNHLAADWSERTIPGVGLEAVDQDALSFAKLQYAEKYKDASFADKILKWDDWTFLEKAKLAIDGKLTFAAIVLIGKEESEHLISPSIARITWTLRTADGTIRDYAHFKPPMLLAVDRVYAKIRNLTLREMPEGTLFPRTIRQYDHWVVREALHNCIAHQDYQKCASIEVSECSDHLEFCNVGSFAPGTIEEALKSRVRPRHYPNRQLVDAMVELKMIDTVGMGIQTMFSKQRDRAMPLPDYELGGGVVRVTLPGKVIDSRYSNLLLQTAGLSLEKVFLLDKLQKGHRIEREEAARLRQDGLIEGRFPNVYAAAKIAVKTGNEAGYLATRGFDTKFYKQRILEYLCMKKQASAKDILEALASFLPQGRPETSNKRKISSLLSMTMSKREGLVRTVAPHATTWILTTKGMNVCRNNNISCRRKCSKGPATC